MTKTPQTALVLGGTGRTGSLVAKNLAERGMGVRTAARNGADVRFDWDEPTTYRGALDRADRLYLVTPVMRVTYADQVAAFLDLAARRAITHSILRPAWVMQNFSDAHLPVVDGVITVPTGGGREAFVDAADIAAVAVETLLAPEAHAGAQYAPTGPQALTVGEVADTIAAVTGQAVTHDDIDPDTWIGGVVAAGLVPADYAVMLRWLTGSIISGNGSTPNDDVEKVTGRPPAPFGDFARRSRHAWTSPAAR